MLFLIILLSAALILNCIILVFLVLMQLPKKEAGAGLAFGAAASDALFGAGSGNFLTKATKYCAGIFFALAIILSMLETAKARQPGSTFLKKVQEEQTAPTTPPQPANQPASGSQPMTAPGTNGLLMPQVESNPAPTLTVPTNGAPATQSK